MKRQRTRFALIAFFSLTCFTAGLTLSPRKSAAFDLKDVLKVVGIGMIVKQFGGEINKALNKLMSQKGVSTDAATKVVPVLEVGNDTAIGAVQVVGPKSQVDKVRAVAEVELSLGNRIRARALMPIATKSADTETVRGISGVGVSANVKHVL
ncbi:MAG: hypothetical protein COZ06_08125 [Armatimonadetes bacterium CG_4_10_14_3_um_filter_66_18]|nr:hypothetical protein [Armatimonadota bacterium]OIO92802.1 MAG: hypothetical protein AUJ96_31585 [Armatimonadetes bacterium CG2_30_66_41]PIU90376.1 MAG: hypothetical protein COS65_25330 [Armatimonadetes bacterium CG06_land_8_20_14_3_00_66_21]PIW13384.1 MAG: hypothetical protein COW34_09870 [Armatimonadetes bacterium CG17_big_fil_post_rev_8_21_14_2_50_66_6]PIX43007.1 MAG: hypothetical protein COZ57_20165 [Armatimonadetes bacterium CG_4_8_14_3_um_filter_66_20]PIY50668.1 MAG: hypothetical prote